MKNRRIVKNKINLKKVVLLIVLINLIAISIIVLLGGKTSSHVGKSLKTIYVSYGETLWEIAKVESENNEYYSKYDIRYIMRDIKKANNLSSSNLYPGQELLIPCF